MKNPALLEEMKTYKGRDEVPADFDTFWDNALANLAGLSEYKLEEQDFSIPNVVCYEHEMVLFMRELFCQKKIKRFQLFSIFMVIWAVVGIGQTCWLIQ